MTVVLLAHPERNIAARVQSRENVTDRRRIISLDATIGLMAKFKPVRPSGKKSPRPNGAAGCVIFILLLMVGVMIFLYLVMRGNAN
jgi:hypothetical protein